MSADDERRRLPRRQLDLQVELVDPVDGATLGVLVNLHMEGLLMMGGLSLQPDHLYRVTLRPLAPSQPFDPIELVMDCLWTRAMGQQDRVWAGCQIIELAPADRQRLAQLIDLFGVEQGDHSRQD
ncbi:PilZ domain-containing protein [Porticoccus sp.]